MTTTTAARPRRGFTRFLLPIWAVLVFLFFYFDVMQGNLMHTVVAILLVITWY